MVIDHGSIVAEGSPEQLKQQVSGDAIQLTAARADQVVAIAGVAATLPSASAPTVDGLLVEVRVPSGRTLLAGLLRALDAEGLELDAIELRRPTLDDVFLTLTGRSLRDGETDPGAAA